MYGWRAKIGFMLPSSCMVYEQEFLKIIAGIDGVIGCPSRLLIRHTDADGLTEMNTHIEKAAEELSTIDPDLVIYMCTSGSFLEGNEWEREIRDKIKAITKAPVISTSQAVLEGLKALKLSKIAMWTPYDEDITKREVEWLRSNQIEVTDYQYGDIVDNLDRGSQTPERTHYYARKLNISNADGIFVSCANIRAIEILSRLEEDTKKPAISASQATTWLAIRKVGISTPVLGYGSLLEKH